MRRGCANSAGGGCGDLLWGISESRDREARSRSPSSSSSYSAWLERLDRGCARPTMPSVEGEDRRVSCERNMGARRGLDCLDKIFAARHRPMTVDGRATGRATDGRWTGGRRGGAGAATTWGSGVQRRGGGRALTVCRRSTLMFLSPKNENYLLTHVLAHVLRILFCHFFCHFCKALPKSKQMPYY